MFKAGLFVFLFDKQKKKMNTKKSFIIGWAAYTIAFTVGGGIGIYNYWYKPGGRLDRQRAADLQRQEEAKQEAIEEERIRQQRRLQKQVSHSDDDTKL